MMHGMNMKIMLALEDGLLPSSDLQMTLSFTHKSTVARTVMCRQDGRRRFPVLLDDLSKCRTK